MELIQGIIAIAGVGGIGGLIGYLWNSYKQGKKQGNLEGRVVTLLEKNEIAIKDMQKDIKEIKETQNKTMITDKEVFTTISFMEKEQVKQGNKISEIDERLRKVENRRE